MPVDFEPEALARTYDEFDLFFDGEGASHVVLGLEWPRASSEERLETVTSPVPASDDRMSLRPARWQYASEAETALHQLDATVPASGVVDVAL
ncbi:MAG: hypothetical protein AAF726_01900 [Planctomycetota bacterium]